VHAKCKMDSLHWQEIPWRAVQHVARHLLVRSDVQKEARRLLGTSG
jgi:hypothetical protein